MVAASPKIGRPEAVQAAVSGARAELSRSGALAPGSGYPRLVIELVRIDEKSTGIVADPPAGGGALEPRARGASVGVVGRAWVEQGPADPPSRDTGDLRRVEGYSGDAGDSRIDAISHDEAVREAASEVGRALARRVLGLPDPDIEPM